LEDVLQISNPSSWVKSDKGYKSVDIDKVLKKMKLKNNVMHKAKKNKPLSNWHFAAIIDDNFKIIDQIFAMLSPN